MTKEIAKIIRKSSGKDSNRANAIAYTAIVTIADAMSIPTLVSIYPKNSELTFGLSMILLIFNAAFFHLAYSRFRKYWRSRSASVTLADVFLEVSIEELQKTIEKLSDESNSLKQQISQHKVAIKRYEEQLKQLRTSKEQLETRYKDQSFEQKIATLKAIIEYRESQS